MTKRRTDLLALATSVVERAHAGEGLEVYVTRGTDTEVRAYEGEVESLTSADSSGVGIRVLLDDDGPDAEAVGSRVGFAWAGSLDPDVIAATLADARDNARFATPDPDVVFAVPDGVAPVELDLWDDGVASTPMEKKVDLALQLERATRAADPRVRQVVLGRLLGQSHRSGTRLDHRHLVVPEAYVGLPLRRRHRGRGRRHADRHRLQRRTGPR